MAYPKTCVFAWGALLNVLPSFIQWSLLMVHRLFFFRSIAFASTLLLFSSSAFASLGQSVSALVGMDRGGLALGANFDVKDTATESYGGYARIFSKDKDEGEPALFAVGAHFKGKVKSGIFEYYLSPGFGLIHHNYDDTRLLLGPTLNIGMSAELDSNVSLGIENSKLYSWIGKYKGLMKDSFLFQAVFSI